MLVELDPLTPAAPFTEADVERLEAAFLQEQQVDCPVHHHFGPGVYVREVVLPTGSYIIGHRHNSPHLNIMLEGHITEPPYITKSYCRSDRSQNKPNFTVPYSSAIDICHLLSILLIKVGSIL